jgi:hypothetical protein
MWFVSYTSGRGLEKEKDREKQKERYRDRKKREGGRKRNTLVSK